MQIVNHTLFKGRNSGWSRALYKVFYDRSQEETFALNQDDKMKKYQKAKGAIACTSNDQEIFVI